MASEFAIIERFFTGLGARRDDVLLGVGDDAALVAVTPGARVVSTAVAEAIDPSAATAEHARGLGAALVDGACAALAADGADARWATIALTLPAADENWIAALARGIDESARAHGVAIVGGDTTAGPGMVVLFANGTAR